jgi:hypothetical protein
VWLLSSASPAPPARRLIILAPQGSPAEPLARAAWALASPAGLDILFLGLARAGSRDYAYCRYLATLAAMTRGNQVAVDVLLAEQKDWIEAVDAVFRSGDLVICHSEQQLTGRFGRGRSLAWELTRHLQTPVGALSGIFPRQPSELSLRLWRTLHDIIALAIVALFFLVEVQIEQLPRNALFYFLYVLVVTVEIGLLFIWYTFIRD